MTESVNLHWLDWAIILTYIIFALGVGIYFSKELLEVRQSIFFLADLCHGGLWVHQWWQLPLLPIHRWL